MIPPRIGRLALLLLPSSTLLLSCTAPEELPRATTITGVRIIDGTGAPSYAGAVRFIGDSIVAAGPAVEPSPGDIVFDGGGLTLAPGGANSPPARWGFRAAWSTTPASSPTRPSC